MLWQARRGFIVPNVAALSPSAGGGAPTDPDIATVKLLLNPTGADGSSTVTDVSPIARGNASNNTGVTVDTEFSEAGNPTLKFAGLHVVQWPDSADWQLAVSGSTFWIETRVALRTSSGYIACQWNNLVDRGWRFFLSGGNLVFSYSTDGSNATDITATWSPTLVTINDPAPPTINAVYDLAVNYDGNKIRLFIDGTMVASQTVGSITIHTSSLVVGLGARSTNSANHIGMYVTRFRLNKGSDRGVGDAGYTPLAAGHFPTS